MPLSARRCLTPFSLIIAGSLLAVVGCGGGGPTEPTPATLEVVTATNGQTAPAGARVTLAVVVRASTSETVARAPVRWTVTSGSGAAVSDSVTNADGNGRAEVGLTLGPTAGTYVVQAQAVDAVGATVTLSTTATAPPTLASVTPTSFTGGDTLTLSGSALSASAEVSVAGGVARVLGGSATSLTVIAPYCLAPGTVDIRARVSGAPSNTVQGTYSSLLGPITLAVGEYGSFDPAQLAGCAEFPAAGASAAEYLLAPQSAATTPGLSADYRLSGDSVVVTVQAGAPQGTPLPLAARFDMELRRQEQAASLLPRPPLAAAQQAAATTAATVKVGDKRQFEVCNNIPCSALTDYAQITARAAYVGTHAALFVDDAAPANGFTDTDFSQVGALFDEQLYEVATTAFGSESDVDANGVVIILFTPEVNRLTPESECSSSVITGFFFGIDIDPAFAKDPRSNGGEVFYAIAPDPSGTVSCSLSTSLVRRLVPVTFIHEFQHMISYNQHVLVRGGSSEVLWLNEGLSHLSEELGALHFESLGIDSLFSRFALGDLYNAYLFLSDPESQFVLPVVGTGSLEERGASWLFLRWLVDQYGSGITRRLVETSNLSTNNVVAAVGVPWDRLVTQWFLANYVSDLPAFDAPSRLKFETWHFRTTFGSLHDQDANHFPLPFPLVPQVFQQGTFQYDGTLRAGSGNYFRVTQDPGQKGFTVLMTDSTGASIPAAMAPRLNVIRIK